MFPSSDAVCAHVVSVPLQNLSAVTAVGLASLEISIYFPKCPVLLMSYVNVGRLERTRAGVGNYYA